MIITITIIHVVMCIILIAIVLLQTGKGADIGAAFGGASHTLFGGAGPANFLNRVTTIAAAVFMITSLGLALLSTNKSTSSIILEKATQTQTQPGPTTNQPPAAPQPSAEQSAPPQNPGEEAVPLEKESTNPSPSQPSSSGASTGTENKQTSPQESSGTSSGTESKEAPPQESSGGSAHTESKEGRPVGSSSEAPPAAEAPQQR
jgi:preprotein translocase subunit SecG